MQQVITAKLKLDLTKEQESLFRDVTLAYRDALNYTSQIAFDNNKLSAAMSLQKLVYNDIRSNFNLPSQMACNVPRQVAATLKGLKKKLNQNKDHLRLGITKKRFKGLDKPPKFTSRTALLNFGRDFSFVKHTVSIITLQGRIKVPYHGYNKHLVLIKQGAKIGGAKLYYSSSSKTYFLLVSIELELPNIQPTEIKKIVGVDVGQRYLAVTTDVQNNTEFFSGKQVVHLASHLQRVKKRLQQKGTRSAKRRLVRLSQRERRLKADTNHQIAKQIATPNTLIGLEYLTHIRERTERRSNKKDSKKRNKANKKKSSWAFAALHYFIDYKAILNNSLAIKVDADYTSQSCVCCGHTSKDNRPEKGLLFHCVNCNFKLHADLLGARNVALRTLFIRQDWMKTGELSARPDVSDKEAKAARLSSFAELRWSSDTSSRYNPEGFSGE